MRWNKKIFALLLESARGERSWLQFSNDCGISYVQIRKLAQEKQENPPRDKLICKVASAAENGITLFDLRFAAGSADGESDLSLLCKKYRLLSETDRRTALRFIDFLTEDSHDASEEQHRRD